MRILFDQGTPVPLRKHLTGHSVNTAFELGWGRLRNGDLLREAESQEFVLLITTDQNLRYQQTLAARAIAIIILLSTSWPKIQPRIPEIVATVDSIEPGEYVEITI